MSEPRIRPAERRDLPELVRIYNHYALETHITFDTRAFAVEERVAWFEAFAASGAHRLLVAEAGGRPFGYASSHAFRPKPAYAPSVETSIYLDPARPGQGIGGRLYAVLLDVLAAEPGVHRAYAGIALPNPGSIALHERLGFQLVGTFREVGFKLASYWDVSWYERDVSGVSGALGS